MTVMHQEPDIELKQLKVLRQRQKAVNKRMFKLAAKLSKKLGKDAEPLIDEILDIANVLGVE